MAALAYVALAAPPTARAATSADYPNQAAAQRVADTHDADGIYCEDLTCPCLKPGDDGTTTATHRREVRLGR